MPSSLEHSEAMRRLSSRFKDSGRHPLWPARRGEEDERAEAPGLKETVPRIAGRGSARRRAAGLPGSAKEDRRARASDLPVASSAGPGREIRKATQPRGGRRHGYVPMTTTDCVVGSSRAAQRFRFPNRKLEHGGGPIGPPSWSTRMGARIGGSHCCEPTPQ